MKTKYSGKKSHKFWDRVNVLSDSNWQELNSLGCALQNFEEYVLKALNDAEQSEKKSFRTEKR